MNFTKNDPAVRHLQKCLRQLSRRLGISRPPQDGIFAEATEKSLREFQAAMGLPVTGRADEATFRLLCDLARGEAATHSPPRAVHLFPHLPDKRFSIGGGESGFIVRAIQYLLREIGIDYGGMETVPQDGVFGDETASAVARFQATQGLDGTGSVDRATWDALVDVYNIIFLKSRLE